MAQARPSIAGEIERYLRTGESDPYHSAWSGKFMERARQAHEDLRGALIQEVHRLAEDGRRPFVPDVDTTAFTRGKVEPMVRGLPGGRRGAQRLENHPGSVRPATTAPRLSARPTGVQQQGIAPSIRRVRAVRAASSPIMLWMLPTRASLRGGTPGRSPRRRSPVWPWPPRAAPGPAEGR